MQEDVEQRSVTLIISTAKLTGRALKAAITKFLAYQKEAMARASPDVQPKGKQTVKELVGQNQGVANIEINDKNIKDFEKDRTTSPPKYLVFFKARDGDALTAAFKEYTANTVKKQSRQSIIQKLRAILPQVREQAKEKKKELER